MLYEVLQYALRTGITTEPGFTVKNAKWAIAIDSTAQINGIIPLGDPKIGKTFKDCPDLSQGEMIAGGITRSQFLIDSLNVVALFYKADSDSKDIERYHAKHQYFIQQLDQAGNDCPDLLLAANALKDTEQLQNLQHFIESQQPKPKFTDSITLLINDDFPLESDNWHDWWRNYRQQHAPLKEGKKSAALMRCLLTGEMIEPVKTQPKIKGLSSVGGLGTGDVFVGFDKESFRSYGLEQSLNAAMSEVTAKSYAETLNYLISEHRIRLVNSYAVYWFGHIIPKENDPLAFLENPDEPPAGQEIRPKQLLNAIKEGQRPDLLNNYYYCLIISGQAGRVMVRDFQQGQMKELVENVNNWFKDLEVTNVLGEKNARPYGFEDIVTAFLAPRKPKQDYGDWVKPIGSLNRELWQVALTGKIFPDAVIFRLIPFFSTHWLHLASNDERERNTYLSLTYRRLGLLKAYFQRQERKNGENYMHTYLNSEHPEAAYHCGRLMAILARIQSAALDKREGTQDGVVITRLNAGVVQRYYAAASKTPGLTLGRLTCYSQNHLEKLYKDQPKLARWLEKHLAEIMCRLKDEVPASLTLKEQSLFALGYYQQIAALNTRKKENNESNQAEEN